jgi:hypothetical protein
LSSTVFVFTTGVFLTSIFLIIGLLLKLLLGEYLSKLSFRVFNFKFSSLKLPTKGVFTESFKFSFF